MAVETVRLKLNQEQDSLGRLWQAFSKCKPVFEDGHRLENLSWRLWQRELKKDQEPAAVASQLVVLINSIILQQQQLSYQCKTTTPRNEDILNDQQLRAPPRIISIAPTPPSASPAITAPTSPTSHPSALLLLQSDHHHHHLLLSPYPQPPPSDSSDSNKQLDYFHQPSRPSITSSPSTTSTTTSPSIQAAKPETTKRNLSSTTLHRRATSTIGFKHKRQPLSNARVHPTTSRSVSPRLGQTREPASSQQEQSPWLRSSSSLSSSEPLEDFSKPTDLTQTTTTKSDSHWESNQEPNPSTTGYNSSASLPSLVSPIIPVTPNNSHVSAPFHLAEGIIPDSLASSHTTTCSSNFMPDPPPPTPSQNGAPLPTTMSVGLQKNKNKMTALLPSILPAISPTPTTTTTTTTTNNNGGGKKKAKFFIKEYEADDDKILSPTSFPTQPVALAQLPRFTQPAIQPLTQCTPTVVAQSMKTKEVVQLPSSSSRAAVKQEDELEEEDEEFDGSDSDEWGSEYSEEEEEAEKATTKKVTSTVAIAERAKLIELEKKRKQEEYHRQLFAKKFFVQRNRSHDSSEINPPPPIRRAGLSMLFHPELNHLQHHPTSTTTTTPSARGGEGSMGFIRNQSAVELRRRQGSTSSKPTTNEYDSQHHPQPQRMSTMVGSIPRPCSLIKSKSTVAVPVLAGQDPPVMVQRSPSSLSGHSSLLVRNNDPRKNNTRRNSAAPTIGANTKIDSDTTTSKTMTPNDKSTVASARNSLPPQTQHQRHPSRLAGKPTNVEYSDDSSSSESSESFQEEVIRTKTKKNLIKQQAAGDEVEPTPMARNVSSRAITSEPIIAPPLSPRTTRRNMLANEMTESVRRNLLWERQMRDKALGIVTVLPNNLAPSGSNLNPHTGDEDTKRVGAGTSKTNIDNTNQNNPQLGNNPNPNLNPTNPVNPPQGTSRHHVGPGSNNKEYRNFSKGFHRTGW
ncbi:hypothetical protein PSTT_09574 [Puccinia striiformis]|uniref:Uncharacterized protein n=1 Tax=Puccinia striiformis TaxID=27350 RepID=A0A2S4V813_9BASI|nr:hypothetical protein PSTT_09574 [Puccinia striiformis]